MNFETLGKKLDNGFGKLKVGQTIRVGLAKADIKNRFDTAIFAAKKTYGELTEQRKKREAIKRSTKLFKDFLKNAEYDQETGQFKY